MPIFSAETTTGDVLNSIKIISGIIKAKGGRVKGNRLIFLEVENGHFKLYVDTIFDFVSNVKVSGKGKVSLNYNTVLKVLKTYPQKAPLNIEAHTNYLLLNGNLEVNEQYSINR